MHRHYSHGFGTLTNYHLSRPFSDCARHVPHCLSCGGVPEAEENSGREPDRGQFDSTPRLDALRAAAVKRPERTAVDQIQIIACEQRMRSRCVRMLRQLSPPELLLSAFLEVAQILCRPDHVATALALLHQAIRTFSIDPLLSLCTPTSCLCQPGAADAVQSRPSHSPLSVRRAG